jgi:glucan phosphoethanolaminetransferase (alkaline phosphatase superfamily)
MILNKKKLANIINICLLCFSLWLLFRCIDIRFNIINIATSICFILFVSQYKWLYWFIFFPVIVFLSLYLPIGLRFGFITSDYLITLYSTNTAESADFLSKISVKYIVYSIFLLTYFIIWGKFLVNKKKLKTKNKPILIIYLIGGIIFVPNLVFFYELYFSITKAITELNDFKQNINKNDWKITNVNNKYKNYVLIIGESGSKFHHGLYGYSPDTTPFLSHVNSTVVNGMLSPATHTIPSLIRNLTLQENFKPRYNLNLVDLVNTAGFTSYWISNQNYVGQYATPITAIGLKSNYSFFQKKIDAKTTTDYDLLEVFKKYLRSSHDNNRNFFIIHLHDLHPYEVCDVIKRYQRFNFPIKLTKKYRNINCYNQIMYFTDKLIKEIYNELKETNESFSMIYFSDHGIKARNFKDTNTELMHSEDQEGYHIPLIRISSDDTSRQIINIHKTGLFFTNGMATWLGIDTTNIKQKYDLFSNVPFNNEEEINHISNIKSLPLQPVMEDNTLKLEN